MKNLNVHAASMLCLSTQGCTAIDDYIRYIKRAFTLSLGYFARVRLASPSKLSCQVQVTQSHLSLLLVCCVMCNVMCSSVCGTTDAACRHVRVLQ